MRRKILLAVALVMAPALAAQAQVWDVEYDGSVNPWSASPAWTGTKGGTPDPVWGPAVTNVADPYFIIDTSSDNSQTEYFTIDAASGNWTADFVNTGLVYEVKARVFDGTNLGHSVTMSDGTNLVAMQFRNTDTADGLRRVRINNVWVGHQIPNMDDWHTYRLELSGTGFDLLIDGAQVYSGSYAASASNQARWGDQTSGGNGLVHYSTIRWAYVPEPSALALAGIGGILLLRRRRRA